MTFSMLVLDAGVGNDYLNGGVGDDSLSGGTNNDTYIVDSLGESITENVNQGFDTVLSSVSWTLGDDLEYLRLTGTDALFGTGNALNNSIIGNSINNSLFGAEGNDTLNGQDGDDLLDGGSGDDTLSGGTGGDILVGNFGNDILTGNAGADSFALSSPNQGSDRISDFVVEDDTLSVKATEFGGGLTLGWFLSAERLLVGSGVTAANTASQRFIYNTATGSLFFDADGNLSDFGTVQIAMLSNKPLISSSDILIV